jgi:glycosyltransferase involved in cell wall biosynthesis
MMKRRRVVLDACCLGRRKTGNETYIRGLIEGFRHVDLGDTEIVAATTPVCDLTPPTNLRFHRMPLGNFLTRNFLALPRRLKSLQADLFHGVYWTRFWDSFPKVVTIHDISFLDLPGGYRPHERWVYNFLIQRAALRASHVITVSEFSRKRISECWGIPPEKITVTHLAVDECFKPKPGVETVPAAPFVLYVGNLHPRKNLVRLLEAFTLLKMEHPSDLRLRIVGQKAWLTGEIFQCVHQNHLEDFVDFTGYVGQQELVDAYQNATVTAYPSLYEGFGFPVLEAMSCGCPVVASNTTSIPEVAGNAGIQVDPRDTRAIADAIWKVVSSEPLRREMREKGLAQAALFSWTRAATETAAVYRKVLDTTTGDRTGAATLPRLA